MVVPDEPQHLRSSLSISLNYGLHRIVLPAGVNAMSAQQHAGPPQHGFLHPLSQQAGVGMHHGGNVQYGDVNQNGRDRGQNRRRNEYDDKPSILGSFCVLM